MHNVTIVADSNLFFPNVGTGGRSDLVIITGSENYLRAYEGDDVVVSFGNNNYVNLGDGDDFALALGGRAIFFGGEGDDTLIGGVGDDWLMGAKGADALLGGEGDDTIIFDVEDRFISGGRGADVFTFQKTVESLVADNSTPGFFYKPIFETGAVSIADFNPLEGDVLNMSVLGAGIEVRSDVANTITFTATDGYEVIIIGVSFKNVYTALKEGSLVLDSSGKG